MRSKYSSNFLNIAWKPLILTFTLIVLLFYFNGITESALAQLSTTAISTNNATPTNNSSNNSKCFNPSIINSIRILKINVLPPKFVMIYAGKVYQGELSQSKFRGGETLSQLHIQARNLTTNLPSKIVQVKEGSCVQFAIIGYS